jgi:hypothetical protein
MKKLFKIVLASFFIFLFQSCYYDTVLEEEIIPPPDDVSYQNDIQPLWNTDCVSCHNGVIPPDYREDFSYASNLNGYVVPFKPEESILYKSLLGIDGVSLMPPDAKWSENKINLVKAWIEQGAKDN